MFDWNDLKYVLALAHHGRLSAVGKQLGVDHTTVSRRISALEQELDVRLFDRSPKGYTLTSEGHRMLPFAEKIESQAIALSKDISGLDTAMSGIVRLATPEALGSQFLTRHWISFRRDNPNIEVELVAAARRLSMTKREADIAVTLSRPTRGRLVAQKAGRYRLRLYGSSTYLRSHPPIQTFDDLANHDFIWYVDDLLEYEELQMLHKNFRSPRVVFRSTNVTGQANAAVNGIGLALLPCFLADQMPELVPVLGDASALERDLWVVTHEDLRHVARMEAVVNFLTATFKKESKILLGSKSK